MMRKLSLSCHIFDGPPGVCIAASRKAGANLAHSAFFILGAGVQRRSVNSPAPVKPPHNGTLSPNWTSTPQCGGLAPVQLDLAWDSTGESRVTAPPSGHLRSRCLGKFMSLPNSLAGSGGATKRQSGTDRRLMLGATRG